MAKSSAYEKYPEHTVVLEPNPTRVHVELAGETIADTRHALRCLEGSYPPVLYIPREDVRSELLEKTDHTTYCPFKGHASYYSVRVGDRVSENALWSYEDPYDEVAELKGFVAFYPDRVDEIREDAQ